MRQSGSTQPYFLNLEPKEQGDGTPLPNCLPQYDHLEEFPNLLFHHPEQLPQTRGMRLESPHGGWCPFPTLSAIFLFAWGTWTPHLLKLPEETNPSWEEGLSPQNRQSEEVEEYSWGKPRGSSPDAMVWVRVGV